MNINKEKMAIDDNILDIYQQEIPIQPVILMIY